MSPAIIAIAVIVLLALLGAGAYMVFGKKASGDVDTRSTDPRYKQYESGASGSAGRPGGGPGSPGGNAPAGSPPGSGGPGSAGAH